MLKILSVLLFVIEIHCYGNEPIIPTKGGVWPKPQKLISYDYYSITPSAFQFKVVGHSCFLLQEAITRYFNIISIPQDVEHQLFHPPYNINLTELNINLLTKCKDKEFPYFEMDESYNLDLRPNFEQDWSLTAPFIWGILRGLETFSQLIYFEENMLLIKSVYIEDYPRYKYRGLLLDTGRHYLPLHIILENLNAMAYNKLNVFHWHIVDDQSFPYQSKLFPELSERGAFHPSLIYTHEDIEIVIEHARLRGIRVIPEFDTPGHTRSWGKGIQNILSTCNINGHQESGPMNPTKESLYTFLKEFFVEVATRFPEEYWHLGGDEVEFFCWNNDTHIIEFMEKENMQCFEALQNYHMERLFAILRDLKRKIIVWEEVFTDGANLPRNAIVQVWRYPSTLKETTLAGYQSIYSACWYLDSIQRGADWVKYYNCNPDRYLTTTQQKTNLIGGEACMWGEDVDESNVISRIWPRASAAAEILWSPRADYHIYASKRLVEHACRMKRRGIPAQPPNGPGFCYTYGITEPYITKIRQFRNVGHANLSGFLYAHPPVCSRHADFGNGSATLPCNKLDCKISLYLVMFFLLIDSFK